MKLQTSPNRWSCLPTAFGIATGISVNFIIKWLGHDGSLIVDEDLPEPDRRQSFHIQELIGWAWWRGFSVTPFEANPIARIDKDHERKVNFANGNVERMLSILHSNVGVLTGQSVATGQHHAVAWSGVTKKVYNPSGKIQTLEDFAINTFWCLAPRSE